jgi:CubicO group peptidase (beta-lactamase class C family)
MLAMRPGILLRSAIFLITTCVFFSAQSQRRLTRNDVLFGRAQSVERNFTSTKKDAERLARFEKQTEQLRSLLKIPGLSAVIIKDERVIWAKGFGYADVVKRTRATPDTIYHVASITKTFAATILMQLVEQGKLDLDEPMSHYSSEFKDDSVKIKHLSRKVSG